MSKKNLKRKLQKNVFTAMCITLAFLVFLLSLQVAFLNRIFPFISINSIPVDGLTKEEALIRLSENLKNRLSQTLSFTYKNQNFDLNLEQSQTAQTLSRLPQTINEAFAIGRDSFYPFKGLLLTPAQIKADISLTDESLIQIENLANSVNEPAIDAQIKLEGNTINVTPSQEGSELDSAKLKMSLVEFLQTGKEPPRTLPMKTAKPKLTYEAALRVKSVLDQVKTSPLQLTNEKQTYNLDLNTLLNILDLQNSTPERVALNKEKLDEFLSSIAQKIDRPVGEPLFSFDQMANNGKGRVSEFTPPQDGYKLDIREASRRINQALNTETRNQVSLPVEKISPKNRLTNEMGIKELVARGTSMYEGSIANRIFNVELTAKKINGILVAPGETFSFVNTVGDISGATGFKPAYVIKSGRTVLDDGGGVCQVSTTLFRAALNAGLPIVKRTAHAYRVHYYEEDSAPGIDATIFHPSVDLQFKNDTPGHLLIQAYTTKDLKLFIDFYGTADGRVVEMTKPVITSQTPAPPELRQDDPTLPKGVVKQVDWAASGANVFFKRKVTNKEGKELINETFYSNYKPWQAVYLVGTKE